MASPPPPSSDTLSSVSPPPSSPNPNVETISALRSPLFDSQSQPPSSPTVENILNSMDLPKPISPLHPSLLEFHQEFSSNVETVTTSVSPLSSLLDSQPQPPSSPTVENILNSMLDLPRPVSPLHHSLVDFHQPPPSSSETITSVSSLHSPVLETSSWSTEEERSLSEGLKQCGYNWAVLSRDFVKTKTANQIKHHVQQS